MMNSTTNYRKVDQTEIRVMQISVMIVLAAGFVTDLWQVIAFQAGVFLLTIISPALNPFIFLYRFVLRPLKLLEADWRDDNMEAHRFASMIGLSISSAATCLLYTGQATVGWSLVWLILVFGVLALSGWCAGCFTYYMIQKTGIKGYFKYAPVQGSFPGTRPPRQR